MRSIRVALYVRVSTDKQAEFGMSLDAQKAELERYCRDRNWTIAGLYIDGGFSGKNTDRPEFQRMIGAIRDGGIDGIVVTKLDRLTRSVRNLCELNEDILRPHNVNLVCIRDGINTFEVGGTLLLHLLAVIGQIERENTSQRTAAAIAHIQNSGGHYGKIPFGKTTAPHPTQPKMKILVEHPEEGPWLKQIFAWYAEGKQPTEIAHLLNAQGVKPRYCDKWTLQVVYSLLRVNGVHKARSAGSPFTYDRQKAYKIALALRQDGAKLDTIAQALTRAQLRYPQLHCRASVLRTRPHSRTSVSSLLLVALCASLASAKTTASFRIEKQGGTTRCMTASSVGSAHGRLQHHACAIWRIANLQRDVRSVAHAFDGVHCIQVGDDVLAPQHERQLGN